MDVRRFRVDKKMKIHLPAIGQNGQIIFSTQTYCIKTKKKNRETSSNRDLLHRVKIVDAWTSSSAGQNYFNIVLRSSVISAKSVNVGRRRFIYLFRRREHP